MSNVKVNGVHCHIGSQIFDIEPFCKAAEIMMNFVGDLKDKLGLEIDKLGTLVADTGISCIPKMTILYRMMNIFSTFQRLLRLLQKKEESNYRSFLWSLAGPIIAPAGITLYTVGGIKDIKNVRKYVCQ